jgi:muconate cycloisomerase
MRAMPVRRDSKTDQAMPDSAITIPAELRRYLAIAAVRSTIVDVPTVRRHKLSQTSVTAQSYVIVEARLANGVVGIGEAATLGGPRWSEESVEAIKANIDAYIAPALLNLLADQFVVAGVRMDAAAKRNNAAKAAIETALFDAVGRTLGVAAAQLLGGIVRERIPVLWTLASGDPGQEIEEAEQKLAARLHDTFKVKIGAVAPEADLARLYRLANALEGRAPDRRCQPGLGRDHCAALPAGVGRARRAVGRAAAAGVEPRRHGAHPRPRAGAADG